MKTLIKESWTAEKYLDFERAAEQKHELINGTLNKMAGASFNHGYIIYNIGLLLADLYYMQDFGVIANDVKVYNPQTGGFYYPDVVVFKEPARALDGAHDTLLNPLVIFEVLSISTEKTDKTLKKEAYESIETLTDYLIVSQTEMLVERFTKNEFGRWNAPVLYTQRSEKIDFGFIGLTLSKIYHKIIL